MSLALYMDHHVDAAITQGLRRRGIDVLTCLEDGTTTLDDELLLERTTHLGRVLFSQDDDLLAIAHHWSLSGLDFSGLIYAHQLNITVGQAVRDLELLATIYDVEDMRNRVEYLPIS